MTIQCITTPTDAAELDTLLWHVLWEPLSLPRDIRHTFALKGEELELAAKNNGRIVGALVAMQTSDTEMELRHLAVASTMQYCGIGRSLVTELFRIAVLQRCERIRTVARNTSEGFFRRLGFTTAQGDAPQHPAFRKHGITLQLMEKVVEQNT